MTKESREILELRKLRLDTRLALLNVRKAQSEAEVPNLQMEKLRVEILKMRRDMFWQPLAVAAAVSGAMTGIALAVGKYLS